ncbi:MAG TPA: VapC toxin family PIN domain ribonuclease [Vicinamibacteria bacterium]|nr:VapC toxin family PIN domain ribonuclease [Vicinamibacteria bacterium]
MSSIAVVDTGPLVAATNRADPQHEACLEVLRTPEYALVIPALCVAEAAFLIQSKKGYKVESLFLRGLEAFDVQAPFGKEWERIAELVEEYADFPLGGTDASVVALAERFETDVVITLDRRHFEVIRPKHRDRFRLLPR